MLDKKMQPGFVDFPNFDQSLGLLVGRLFLKPDYNKWKAKKLYTGLHISRIFTTDLELLITNF